MRPDIEDVFDIVNEEMVFVPKEHRIYVRVRLQDADQRAANILRPVLRPDVIDRRAHRQSLQAAHQPHVALSRLANVSDDIE